MYALQKLSLAKKGGQTYRQHLESRSETKTLAGSFPRYLLLELHYVRRCTASSCGHPKHPKQKKRLLATLVTLMNARALIPVLSQVTFVEISAQFLPENELQSNEFTATDSGGAKATYEWVSPDQSPEARTRMDSFV